MTRAHRFYDADAQAENFTPSVAVILCIRGNDPFLRACISALLELDYPNYRLHIVVDNESDPAMELVHETIASDEKGLGTVHVLSKRYETCGLKCSSLIQAIDSMDEKTEVVVFVDADVVVHRNWLRDLISPLSDSDVAVATGNRWYQPATANLGSVVRYVWNAAAVVQMVCFDVPWGGTLAIKRSFIDQADLLNHWKHGFCEDTMLLRHLKTHGLRMAFVPSLLMINRESCTLRPFVPWVARQLITLRLHHSCWPGTVTHGVLSIAIPGVAVIAMVVATYSQQWDSFLGLAGALVFFQLSLVVLMIAAQWMISHELSKTRSESTWPSARVLVWLPVAIIGTQVSYSISLAQAITAKTVRWRGIQYKIEGGKVRMQGYAPYVQHDQDSVVESL